MNSMMIIYKKKYVNKSRLFLADVDSLMYEIETKNAYEDFSENKELFGFRNYSAESKYYDGSNALVVAKMKDIMGSISIEEFVGLDPKLYSIIKSDSSKYKKAKGVNKNVVAKISHKEF